MFNVYLFNLLIYLECWQGDPDKRPDMQQVVLILNQLKPSPKKLFNNFQDSNQSNNNATEWIKNAIKMKLLISYLLMN